MKKEEVGYEIVKAFLRYIGEDPTREGLAETPLRVVKAWEEWFRSYHTLPPDTSVLRQNTQV